MRTLPDLEKLRTFQSHTQRPRAFWSAGERPERLWDADVFRKRMDPVLVRILEIRTEVNDCLIWRVESVDLSLSHPKRNWTLSY